MLVLSVCSRRLRTLLRWQTSPLWTGRTQQQGVLVAREPCSSCFPLAKMDFEHNRRKCIIDESQYRSTTYLSPASHGNWVTIMLTRKMSRYRYIAAFRQIKRCRSACYLQSCRWASLSRSKRIDHVSFVNNSTHNDGLWQNAILIEFASRDPIPIQTIQTRQ